MASNSSSCPTPGGGHLNGYPVTPYAFFFPHMLGGLSPPSSLPGIQHQLPVSGYSTPSPASEYGGPGGWGGVGTGGRGAAGPGWRCAAVPRAGGVTLPLCAGSAAAPGTLAAAV